MKRSKTYRAAVDKIEEGKFYTPTEAVEVARVTGSKKFDSTVEVALKLGVDPRKADQMVRGTVILPHGTGKTARVIVFATGAAAEAAIAAGAANPAPPIGPALGQHGVNIMEFCKAYNAATENQRGNVIPVEITVYEDRSFTFILKTPPAAELIKKAAGVTKGSPTPHTVKVARLSKEALRSIAEQKQVDLNANDIEAAEKIIAGTARSMGITVTD